MDFDTDSIVRITTDACAMFGLNIVAEDLDPADATKELAGRIDIGGEWDGIVEMGCSNVFARRLASVMFEMDPDEMDDAEVFDAFGELVNVTTGNIKALLPGGCTMGIPRVEQGVGLEVEDADRVQQWGFSTEGQHLTVIIRKAA